MNPADFILGQPWAMSSEHVGGLLTLVERFDPETLSAKAGRPMEGTETVQVRDGVAIIPVRGVISRYENFLSWWFGGSTVETMARDFRAALDNPNVRAVVLEIDSPGGQATGIGEFAAQVRAGSTIKPVCGYAAGNACSGAYWILAACPLAVMADSAVVGSIGVVQPMTLPRKDGSRQVEFVSTQSPNKRPDPESEAGKAEIQATLDAMCDVFLGAVAEYRKTTPEKVASDFGAGGVKVGKHAVDAGMADRLGSLESLISELSRGGRAGMSLPPSRPNGAAAVGNLASKDQSTMKLSMTALMAYWFGNGQPEEIDTDALATGDKAKEAAPPKEAAKPPAKEATIDAAAAAAETDAQVRRLVAETIRKDRVATHTTAAASWVAGLVKAEKITPAESAGLAARYVAYAMTDAENPIVVQEGDKPVTLSVLDDFKARYEAKTPANRTKEQVATDAADARNAMAANGWKTLDNAATEPTEAEKAASAARIEAMLKGSETGREALAARK